MLNKIELFVVTLSVIGIASAIYVVQERFSTVRQGQEPQTQIAQVPTAKLIVVNETRPVKETSIIDQTSSQVNGSRMVIDDIRVGTGAEAKTGNTVLVHYVGTLQDGTVFDNSRKRGDGFKFTLGKGQVIRGWEEGVVGMKEGGKRVLVIPPDKAYGKQGSGTIPGQTTLVFNIHLVEVKK